MSEAQEFMRLTDKTKYLPCRDTTYTENFFVAYAYAAPEKHEDTASTQLAKELCSHCPIMEQCRAEGIRIQDKWSVYGGLSPADREELLEQEQEYEIAA